MKKIIFFLLFLCSSFFLNAQITFNGKLILKDQAFYNYKLVLHIDSVSKKVTGYSITDEKGKEETKTLLVGTFNPSLKKIYFKETQIEKTKVKSKDISFCFVEADLTFSKYKDDFTLVGKFTGKLFPKNEVCGTGGIFVKEIKIKKKKEILKEEIPTIKIEKKPEEKDETAGFILVNTDTKLVCNSDSVIVEVWDHGKLDDDVVSILVNGIVLVSDLKLTAVKKQYKIPLSKQHETIISVLAENEGSYSPNTAAISVISNGKTYKLICKNQVDEMKSIRIVR